MRKTLLFALPLMLCSSAAMSQVELRTSDLLRLGAAQLDVPAPSKVLSRLRNVERNNKIEMIVRYDSESTLKELEKAGAEIISLVGTRTAIVSAAPSAVRGVAASKGVTGAMLSAPVKRANNDAAVASKVDAVRNGVDLPKGFTGEGAIIGVFDVGMDPNHINFQDEEGNSRIKMFWNYPGQTAKPDIYDTPAKISTFTTDNNTESHGSHVLGIMAGSFIDKSKEDAPDYRGMAPGAEIVAAAGMGYNVQILDAIERIGKYAQEKGKPCVINLSFGDNIGPHDGSDEFTEAINDIAKKYNAAICLAGGNEADQNLALVKILPEDEPVMKTLLVKNNSEVGGNFQVYGPVEIWTTDDTPFEVTLDIVSRTNPDVPLYSFTVPTKKETYVVQGNTIDKYLSNTGKMELINEGTEFHNLYVNSFMGGICGTDPYNNCYNAKLNFYIEGRTPAVVSRNSVKVTVKGKPGQKIFMNTDGYYMSFGSRNIPGLDDPDGYGTNSNMAAGKETFAVGSYVTKNVSGSGFPAQNVGTISYFSSFGETLDGRMMPDLTAPGQVIISTRNSYMPSTATYTAYYPLSYSYTDSKRKKNYYWTTCAGTSQSSPHVAGVMALMRGANPELSYQEIYEIARKTADPVEDGTSVWGHGKLNAYAAVKAALDSSSIEELSAAGAETILFSRNGDAIEIFAAGEESISVEVISLTGITVKSFKVNGGETTVDTSGLPAGIYLLRVSGNQSGKTVKIRL